MTVSKKDLVLMARAIEWQQALDKYTEEQLKSVRSILAQAEKDLVSKLKNAKSTEWTKARSNELLKELEPINSATTRALEDKIASVAAEAGSAAYTAHSNILSFGGAATGVTAVTATTAQLHSMIVKTPVGGNTLNKWFAKTFTRQQQDRIKKEIAAGVLNAESYREMAARLKKSVPATKREIETITKTYVQSMNVQANKDVYDANKDVVRGVRWLSAMGDRTCVRCAGLDGNEYVLHDHPDIPLHPNCRCVLVPITVSPKAMGLPQEVINDVARPYSLQGNKVIGLGGAASKESGVYVGGFDKWYTAQSAATKKQIIGKTRMEMVDSGRVEFKDLVDPKTGRLLTLKELEDAAIIGRNRAALQNAAPDTTISIDPPEPLSWKTAKTAKVDASQLKPGLDDFIEGRHPLTGSNYPKQTGPADLLMEKMNVLSGADALPELVDGAVMDKLIAEGAEPLYRGVSKADFAEQLKSGKFFAGKGIYGNGTYTAYGGDGLMTAANYAGPARNSGGMSVMVLKKDAKVATHKEIRTHMQQNLDTIEKKYEALIAPIRADLKAGKISEAAAEKLLDPIELAHGQALRMNQDYGRVALAHGYDAIDVMKQEYMVVLNRGALIVQKEAINMDGDIL